MSGLPTRARGRQTAAAEERYQAELAEFCRRILQIRSRIDFKVGTRGWCYLLEGEHVITKGEFDAAERLIARCRKDGSLPLDICAEDDKRATNGLEKLDSADIEAEADWIVEYAEHAHASYTPFSFWDDLPVYVEMAAEKSDLKSLFSRVTQRFQIAIQNVGGWADINVRAGIMRRFQRWEERGKNCVLLYCGDHDPGGLNISEWLLSNLKDLENAVGWHPNHLTIERFGLDHEFIEANGLTWIDNLETSSGGNLADPKHPDHRKDYVQSYLRRFGARKVEANALVARPEAGRELCRQAILRWVPEDAIERYGARLREVREELRRAVARRLFG